jgi:general secretion pathway protein A
MYQQYFGLRELPFELTPNPRFLFLSAKHREALANLRHGIWAAKGISLLIGEAGTGKTTLVRTVLEEAGDAVNCLYLNNPTLTRNEFSEFLAKGFGLSDEAARSKTALLFELEAKLKETRARDKLSALVVDESQSLPNELLEEIRLLANIETLTEKLLPVVLVGQPELGERLNTQSLRQLKQRVALRCELLPLTLHETASYIASRIRIAGGDCSRIFTREAVTLIHDRASGIPRTISVLCDNALVSGFALDRQPVGRDIVQEICRDFDLEDAGSAYRADAGAAAVEESPTPALAAVAGKKGEPPRSLPAPEKRRRFSFFLS